MFPVPGRFPRTFRGLFAAAIEEMDPVGEDINHISSLDAAVDPGFGKGWVDGATSLGSNFENLCRQDDILRRKTGNKNIPLKSDGPGPLGPLDPPLSVPQMDHEKSLTAWLQRSLQRCLPRGRRFWFSTCTLSGLTEMGGGACEPTDDVGRKSKFGNFTHSKRGRRKFCLQDPGPKDPWM